jgi:hypothetical protein
MSNDMRGIAVTRRRSILHRRRRHQPDAIVRACQAPWAQPAPTVTLQRRVLKPPLTVPRPGDRPGDPTQAPGTVGPTAPSEPRLGPPSPSRTHRRGASDLPAQGRRRHLPTATPPSKPLAPPRRPSLPAPSPYPGSTAAGRETPASLSKRTGKGMAAAADTTRALPGGLSRRRRWGEGRKAAGVRVSGCRPRGATRRAETFFVVVVYYIYRQ